MNKLTNQNPGKNDTNYKYWAILSAVLGILMLLWELTLKNGGIDIWGIVIGAGWLIAAVYYGIRAAKKKK